MPSIWALPKNPLDPSGAANVSTGVSFVLLLLFGLFISRCYQAFFSPLAKVPGPLLAKFTRGWQILKYYQGNWHSDIEWLHKKYGPVVRIAPNEVSFVDHAALRQLYSYAKAAPKTDWYNVWNPSKTKSISFFAETNIPQHAKRRRQVAQAYSMSSVLAAETFIQKVADETWIQFHKMAREGKTLDLDWWVTGFAYDVVGELGFGEPFGFIKAGEDKNGIMDSVLTAFTNMGNLGYIPGQTFWIRNPVSKFLSRYIGKDNVNAYPNFLAQVNKRILERRARGNSDRRDMLQQFFEAKTDKREPISHADVLSEAANVLGAGADTTSIGIKACLGFLLLNPDRYRQLQKELDTYWAENDLNSNEITYKQCLEIPLLQAVVKESTRLHPSIIFQLPRVVPPEGITIRKYFIPGNAHVSMSPRVMNRDKEVFGDDAEVWRPERWLEEPERAKYMDSMLATFGYGSRSCIGKNIALVEMSKFVAQFLHQFDAKVVNEACPWKLYTIWMCIQQEMWIRVMER
ncbi:hypothetical protein NM208_g5689 [Fusarium decemcellulare]|uniref:Uncharacterized protein n=1 Tax=Fusarium decemcellulare TaxID=57161 RepID=A0ACC1SFV3_9HYPO|nr:hypothetical protein NM208_g5689 [Fusarium decemcellulare]